ESWASSGFPIGAIYILREARPPRLPGIERPNAIDAALLLRKSAYRPSLVARTGQSAEYFKAAAVIAGSTDGVFYLTRPLDFAAIPEVVGWLEDHWAEIGLKDRAT